MPSTSTLKPIAAQVKDPPPWDESKGGKVIKPDPPKPTEKVLSQRILLSLARLGRAAERAQVKSMTEQDFVRPNILFFRETNYPWDENPEGTSRGPMNDLVAARRLIEKHGYHRRDEELADAEGALSDWSERD